MTDKEKEKTIPTTFNMRVKLKAKAKMFIAYHNQSIDEGDEGSEGKEKLDLGKLVNDALDSYLSDVQVG